MTKIITLLIAALIHNPEFWENMKERIKVGTAFTVFSVILLALGTVYLETLAWAFSPGEVTIPAAILAEFLK